MTFYLLLILLLLNVTNVALHTIGALLLLGIHKDVGESTEQIYVINLAVCEALLNFLEGTRCMTGFFPLCGNTKEILIGIQKYTLIVMFTGISFVYYLDMIYLTLDRLFVILLNIKYPLYWNEAKAKWLLRLTWIIGVSLSIVISLLTHFTEYIWQNFFFKYFYPILEFGFIILAVLTYSFIFLKYKETRDIPSTIGPRGKHQSSLFQVFRKSRFYITVLLTSTFLTFMVTPDLIYLFVGVVNGNKTEQLLTICWISYAVSNLSDAWIYIFMQKSVKKLLLKKLKLLRRTNVIVPRIRTVDVRLYQI